MERQKMSTFIFDLVIFYNVYGVSKMYFYCKYFGLLKDSVGQAILLLQCICMLS